MNNKISFLTKIFKNYSKITFYEILKESEINTLAFISTVPSGKISNGFVLERCIYTEESYYKKQQILKIFKRDVIVIYNFAVLDLMKSKLDLDSITYDAYHSNDSAKYHYHFRGRSTNTASHKTPSDNPLFRRLTKKMDNGIIKTKRRR